MTGWASLLSLSPELIFQIVDHTSCPSIILSLALTCSAFHSKCQPVLKQHRDAYRKYRVTSDLSPETVLHLLRDGPTAEIERWHVRELEIWGSRLSWRDWRSWVPELPGAYGLAEENPSRSALSAQELQTCTRKIVDLWKNLPESEIAIDQRELQSGADSILKMLLVASCPRLHSIRFARRPNDSCSSLFWIGLAISWSSYSGNKMPPGFKSLENVFAGVSVGVLPEEDLEMLVNCSDIEMLLRLPNLKNLYICEPFPNREFDEEYEEEGGLEIEFDDLYDFPIGTSSVKCLYIDGPCDLSPNFYKAIARAPKELEILVIRGRATATRHTDILEVLVDNLSRKNPQLKRLMVYNGGEFRNHECVPRSLRDLGAIKHFSIAAHDIEWECYDVIKNFSGAMGEEWIQFAFPPNMEAMYVWGHKPSGTLDFLFARLIESGAYKYLKVIYIEYVQNPQTDEANNFVNTGLEEIVFQNTIAAGRKAGVHVWTPRNRNDGGYWKNFPARPDRFDLKTGPYGERPADWRLNLYTGERGPDLRECGCGECDQCLAVYRS